MANIKSAKKRVKISENNRLRNMTHRSKMRTFIKKVRSAIQTGEKAIALTAFREATPVIDSMVNKRIIHRNTAARYKSRLSASIKKLAGVFTP
jgi:small subunit ribosomal protein S20